MEVFIIIITCIGALAAVLVVPEVRRRFRLDKMDSQPSKIQQYPTYREELADFEAALEFGGFIEKYESSIVFLDVYIDEANFHGSVDEPEPYFVLYDESF